jgi:hypothetical protein
MNSSARKRLAIPVACILLLAGAAVYFYRAMQPGTVTLQFDAVMGADPLVFNQAIYPNPGGAGLFSVRDFQFYISNIVLHGKNGDYRAPDSYHLARFDSPSGHYRIDLSSVPRDTYSGVTFSIGVDEEANGSLRSVGDLDPNSRMAWNWEVGYKFLLFEGALSDGDTTLPLVYHVGFAENRKTVRFDLPEAGTPRSLDALLFAVDVMALFNGNNTVDMMALPNVKFDRGDAGLLAGNFAAMISLRQ